MLGFFVPDTRFGVAVMYGVTGAAAAAGSAPSSSRIAVIHDCGLVQFDPLDDGL